MANPTICLDFYTASLLYKYFLLLLRLGRVNI